MFLRPLRLDRLDRAAVLRAAARACRSLGFRLRCANGPRGLAGSQGQADAGYQEQDARGLVQDHGRHRHLLCAGADHGGGAEASAHGRAQRVRRAPWCHPACTRAALLAHAVRHPRAGEGGYRCAPRNDGGEFTSPPSTPSPIPPVPPPPARGYSTACARSAGRGRAGSRRDARRRRCARPCADVSGLRPW